MAQVDETLFCAWCHEQPRMVDRGVCFDCSYKADAALLAAFLTRPREDDDDEDES